MPAVALSVISWASVLPDYVEIAIQAQHPQPYPLLCNILPGVPALEWYDAPQTFLAAWSCPIYCIFFYFSTSSSSLLGSTVAFLIAQIWIHHWSMKVCNKDLRITIIDNSWVLLNQGQDWLPVLHFVNGIHGQCTPWLEFIILLTLY